MIRNIVLLVLSLVWSWSQADAKVPQFKVFVYNDVGVGAQTLREAEIVVGEIFGRAGIAMSWKNCSQGALSGSGRCALSQEDSSVLFVRIVARSRSLSGEAFGVAFVGKSGRGQQADVFYSGIQQMGGTATQSGKLLGHVIAHELGHLLLGMKSHSRAGIMQAQWSSGVLRQIYEGCLTFDKRQSNIMRAQLLGSYTALRVTDVSGRSTLTKATLPAI